jgi:hypothetical protein
MKRPLPVTFVAWFVIALSLFLLFDAYRLADNPAVQQMMSQSKLSVPVRYGMLIIGAFINIGAAVAILKGSDLGRAAYMVWGLLTLAVDMFTNENRLPVTYQQAVYVISIFILTRPSASAYFNANLPAKRPVVTET